MTRPLDSLSSTMAFSEEYMLPSKRWQGDSSPHRPHCQSPFSPSTVSSSHQLLEESQLTHYPQLCRTCLAAALLCQEEAHHSRDAMDQIWGVTSVEGVYLVERGHDENHHEDLAILVDSQVHDPCLVGKLVNVAGGESCVSMGMGGGPRQCHSSLQKH
jgi:hypothetical protein